MFLSDSFVSPCIQPILTRHPPVLCDGLCTHYTCREGKKNIVKIIDWRLGILIVIP